MKESRVNDRISQLYKKFRSEVVLGFRAISSKLLSNYYLAKAQRGGLLEINTHRSSISASVKNADFHRFGVDAWATSEFIQRRLVSIVGARPYPLNELMLMVAAVCGFSPTHIFEWRTHEGKSARIFAEAIKACDLSSEVHSIDLPGDVDQVKHPGDQRNKYVKGISNVFLWQGDGVERAHEIIEGLPLPCRALFFLDGDHSYKSVLRELTVIFEHYPNAAVLLHDTFYQEGSDHSTDSYQAIRKFVEDRKGHYEEITTNLGCPSMTLLIPQQ